MCLSLGFDFTKNTTIDGVFFCVSEERKWLAYNTGNWQLTDRAKRAIAAFEEMFFQCKKRGDVPKAQSELPQPSQMFKNLW